MVFIFQVQLRAIDLEGGKKATITPHGEISIRTPNSMGESPLMITRADFDQIKKAAENLNLRATILSKGQDQVMVVEKSTYYNQFLASGYKVIAPEKAEFGKGSAQQPAGKAERERFVETYAPIKASQLVFVADSPADSYISIAKKLPDGGTKIGVADGLYTAEFRYKGKAYSANVRIDGPKMSLEEDVNGFGKRGEVVLEACGPKRFLENMKGYDFIETERGKYLIKKGADLQ